MLSNVQFKRQKHRVCFLAVSVKFFAIHNVQVLALPTSDNRNNVRIFVLLQPLPHLALAACAVRAVFAPALFAAFGNVAEVAIKRKPFRYCLHFLSLSLFTVISSFVCFSQCFPVISSLIGKDSIQSQKTCQSGSLCALRCW